MTPPTWRALAARARRLGLAVLFGPHETSLWDSDDAKVFGSASWLGRRHDSRILRSALAAALEQLEQLEKRR